MSRIDATYEEALAMYVRGEATSRDVSRVDPIDAALRMASQRAYERSRREALSASSRQDDKERDR